MRALFLAVHRPGRSPSQRFRFEQYIDWLRGEGWHCEHSWVLDEHDDRIFYGRGGLAAKVGVGVKSAAKRLAELVTGKLWRFDVALVQREAFFAGPPFVEVALRRGGTRMVFDFDDAIWMSGVSEANRVFGLLKFAGKVDAIIRRSDLVLAGNPWLAAHARQFNPRVEIVPTTIDTDEYAPSIWAERREGPITIGWSGSFSTLQHFKVALPALRRVHAKFGDRIRFKVIGDGNYREPELGIVGEPWRRDTEVADLRKIDIGIMPLPDDEWSKGKCGLKGLQYMALAIPTLMSPVGVNSDIIADGRNGFLPRSEDDWVERLSHLIEDAALRRRLGEAGRATVVERYSVRAWREHYKALLERAASA